MNLREIVTSAGAEFLGVQGVCIYFRNPNGRTLSLYLKACTVENVSLSLKSDRERVLSFAPYLPEPEVVTSVR